jgi:carboxyl-terminal processing protease
MNFGAMGQIRMKCAAVVGAVVMACIAFSVAGPLRAREDSAETPLSVEEKLYGLSLIWKEASYNFAYFGQVPDLKWDETYQQFIPKVMATRSTVEYYDLLIQFCAQLHDGHTRIFPPEEYRNYYDKPNVLVLNVHRQAIIAAVGESLKHDIPVGSRVIEVDGIATDEYLRTELFPRICASTEDFIWEVGTLDLLKGQKGTHVAIKCLTPAGKTLEMRLDRNSSDLDEPRVNTYPRTSKRFEFTRLENDIAYVALNSFADTGIVTDFEKIVPELRGKRGVIVDLRRNGGGESDVGYAILKYLIDKPVLTFKWKTREHCAAYKAWGKWTSEFPSEEIVNLDEKRKEYLRHYHGAAWREGKSDTIYPAGKAGAMSPMVVLIGPLTASAAEDFLAALHSFEPAFFIGRRSAGFTGTPLIFDLPGGGLALINTTREMFPDGVEIRNGIRPDIEIEPTIQDIIDGKDVALQRAHSFLKDMSLMK